MRLRGEDSPGKATAVLYVYNGDSYEPLARVDRFTRQVIEPQDTRPPKTTVYYYHTALNGLPEAMTSESGQLVYEARYELWGKETEAASAHTVLTVEQNLRFAGQYFDAETGLHYNTFRFYAPECGRFTQPDPIGLAGGINLYAYAPNPLTYIDPLGLCKLRGSNGRFRSAQNIQEEIGGLPNFSGKTPGEIRQTLRNRGYSSVQAHSGGEVWTKALPDGNTVAVRLDPANPRSPSHYADAVPHAHIETVPTSSVSNGNYRPRDVTGRHTATGGVSDRGSNPNHNADVHIPMSPGRFPYN
ncbi:RHS domain-containing protein [Escherichia coli]|nr:RHS domain-containing protein [Escherichia coli]